MQRLWEKKKPQQIPTLPKKHPPSRKNSSIPKNPFFLQPQKFRLFFRRISSQIQRTGGKNLGFPPLFVFPSSRQFRHLDFGEFREFRERPPRVIPEFILAPSPGFYFHFFGIIQGFSTPIFNSTHSTNPEPGRVGNLGIAPGFFVPAGNFFFLSLSEFPKFVLPERILGNFRLLPCVFQGFLQSLSGETAKFGNFSPQQTRKDPRNPEKIPSKSPNVVSF